MRNENIPTFDLTIALLKRRSELHRDYRKTQEQLDSIELQLLECSVREAEEKTGFKHKIGVVMEMSAGDHLKPSMPIMVGKK
jgi:hypothetical protein